MYVCITTFQSLSSTYMSFIFICHSFIELLNKVIRNFTNYEIDQPIVNASLTLRMKIIYYCS